MDAEGKQFFSNVRSDTESAGSVLSVGDDEVGSILRSQLAHSAPYHLSARLADDVANE
jgi:hypothetical protein